MRTIFTAAVMALVFASGAAAAAADQDGVYKAGNGIVAPRVIKEVKPTYTEGAMRRRVQGTVAISVVVQKDGKVGAMEVTRSLDEELDRQAMNALQQWEFKPGTKDGEPVNVRVTVELTFTLRGR